MIDNRVDGGVHTEVWNRLTAALHRPVQALASDPQLMALDVVVVVTAYSFALLLHLEAAVTATQLGTLGRFLPIAVVVHVGAHIAAGSYGQVWREAGIRDAQAMIAAGAGATTLLLVLLDPLPAAPSVVVVLLGGVTTMLLAGGVRFRTRLLARPGSGCADDATRVVLVGSVEVARLVIQQMQHVESPWVPVAVVNGHPDHWGRSMHGVPVFGPLGVLADVARRYDVDQVVLTPSRGDRDTILHAADQARVAGLTAKILPTVDDVMRSRPQLRSIRDLSIDDLLGRREIRTDMLAVQALLTGRRVLITGSGGSIGSEIARQVAVCGPERLVLLDHDETHLHDVMAVTSGNPVPVLIDIRDTAVVDRLFAEEAFDIVFHAAAHKHVPILERFPSEAVLTNVLGTDNLLRAAVRHGVRHFVAISTDKAINPTSVMGATKRLAEQLLLHHTPEAGRYCAVRFGNVLGSRGSVIPTFLRQIERGGPVTVTHPEMTRYFMSTEEAVQLVLQAAALTDGGEIFMLDMGDPVRIMDLAERLIFLSGANPGTIPIAITGIRPGEKLTEELVSAAERELPTPHPDIRIVSSAAPDGAALELAVAELGELAHRHDHAAVAGLVFRMTADDPRSTMTEVGS
ncbi:MAG TPA: nucleoside-diphosphate sugar epimerase/dehydratase [Egicoccus sp.]|nr:nucleoside-diphosphate sugar epimerase/dehydratase [Egicoccus sp.]HSK21706.1 nucleoside-diphosphate sugar epimerase/dehydratase [Egicoccus sp.]